MQSIMEAPVSERQSTLGLGGYDAVSYFLEGRPRPGSFEFKTSWQGMTYCFFTKDNLDKFVKKPESFLPQFGGNCAFACGLFGGKRPGSPQIWKIVDGKLYFNSGYFTSKLWEFMPFLIGRGQSYYQSQTRQR